MKTDPVRSIFLVILVGAGACSHATEPLAPTPEVPKFTCLANSATMRLSAELRSTLPTFGPQGVNDAYVSISKSVPGGFAALFWEDNHFVLTFVEPEKANQARAEIEQALVTRGAVAAGTNLKTAEFRGGARWTFAELDEWDRYIIPKLSGVGGISSTSIDAVANAIRFGVIDETARAQVEARLASIGVSCNLVITVIQPYATAL